MRFDTAPPLILGGVISRPEAGATTGVEEKFEEIDGHVEWLGSGVGLGREEMSASVKC